LDESNIYEFVKEANVVIDAIDVFEMHTKNLVHEAARRKSIYSLRGVPLGFGASLQVFSPQGMSFNEYFKMAESKVPEVLYRNVLDGIAPIKIHERYLDSQVFNVLGAGGQVEPPSICPAVHLAAAMVATEAVLIILQKRKSVVIPKCTQIDLYERVIELHSKTEDVKK
jgi:molybdopterin/thiamine biosynthesis adenylyltransferase